MSNISIANDSNDLTSIAYYENQFSGLGLIMMRCYDAYCTSNTKQVVDSTVSPRHTSIAIGSNGTTREKVIRDERTPLGEFTINAIRPSTRFHRFLAIDYPNSLDIGSALIDGRISLKEYDALQGALDKGEQPSQETAIGGYLGIHGLGTGDLEVHGAFNWTNGCIAMTNEEIDELAESISIGTRISIR